MPFSTQNKSNKFLKDNKTLNKNQSTVPSYGNQSVLYEKTIRYIDYLKELAMNQDF